MSATSSALQIGPKSVGYGLPCAKCKTYYAANLTACPICKSTERISSTAGLSLIPRIKNSAGGHSEATQEQLTERGLGRLA